MSKRKANGARTSAANDNSDDSDGDSGSLLDVDFEWFDLQEIDFHGLKLLLRQLFDADSDLFDLSALTELVVSQPVGSTVKVPEDGVETKETDPFAFLTVLSLRTYDSNPAVRELMTYIGQKAATIPSLCSPFSTLLSLSCTTTTTANVGLILTERFINMPAEIVPPMYKMLLEEIQAPVIEQQSYDFTHYLIISKTYKEIASQLPAMDLDDDEDMTTTAGARQPQKKKSKKGKTGTTAASPSPPAETFYFHPEDEIWHRYAVGYGDYDYSKAWAEGAADSKRAFQEAGIRPFGHVVLIEAARFPEAVEAVERYISSAA